MEFMVRLTVDNSIEQSGHKDKIECFYEQVNICPTCKTAAYTTPLFNEVRHKTVKRSFPYSPLSGYLLHSFYICPSCGIGFYALYSSTSLDYGKIHFGEPMRLFPVVQEEKEFPEQIALLSPEFVEIYNQAYAAEQHGLDKICGVGYRKALEFLVKDYSISKFPEKSGNIEDMNVAQCIREYIEFPQAQTVLERAIWLGNDQTHYKQKHTTKDLEDLKLLISLSVTWINATLETEKAGYEIQRK